MDEIQHFPSLEDFNDSCQKVQATEPDRPTISVIAGFEGLPRNYLLIAAMPRVVITQVRRTRLVLIRDEQAESFRFEKWEPGKHGPFEDLPHQFTPAEGEEFLTTLAQPEDRDSLAKILANARRKNNSKYTKNTGALST